MKDNFNIKFSPNKIKNFKFTVTRRIKPNKKKMKIPDDLKWAVDMLGWNKDGRRTD